jgi:hypothetical protein
MTFKDIVASISQFQPAFEAFENGTPTLDDAKTVNAVYASFKNYFDGTLAVANTMIASDEALRKYLAGIKSEPSSE